MRVQTLSALHLRAKYAHLDVTSNNIMLRYGEPDEWDQIRLYDLGLAQSCVEGIPGLQLAKCLSLDLA